MASGEENDVQAELDKYGIYQEEWTIVDDVDDGVLDVKVSDNADSTIRSNQPCVHSGADGSLGNQEYRHADKSACSASAPQPLPGTLTGAMPSYKTMTTSTARQVEKHLSTSLCGARSTSGSQLVNSVSFGVSEVKGAPLTTKQEHVVTGHVSGVTFGNDVIFKGAALSSGKLMEDDCSILDTTIGDSKQGIRCTQKNSLSSNTEIAQSSDTSKSVMPSIVQDLTGSIYKHSQSEATRSAKPGITQDSNKAERATSKLSTTSLVNVRGISFPTGQTVSGDKSVITKQSTPKTQPVVMHSARPVVSQNVMPSTKPGVLRIAKMDADLFSRPSATSTITRTILQASKTVTVMTSKLAGTPTLKQAATLPSRIATSTTAAASKRAVMLPSKITTPISRPVAMSNSRPVVTTSKPAVRPTSQPAVVPTSIPVTTLTSKGVVTSSPKGLMSPSPLKVMTPASIPLVAQTDKAVVTLDSKIQVTSAFKVATTSTTKSAVSLTTTSTTKSAVSLTLKSSVTSATSNLKPVFKLVTKSPATSTSKPSVASISKQDHTPTRNASVSPSANNIALTNRVVSVASTGCPASVSSGANVRTSVVPLSTKPLLATGSKPASTPTKLVLSSKISCSVAARKIVLSTTNATATTSKPIVSVMYKSAVSSTRASAMSTGKRGAPSTAIPVATVIGKQVVTQTAKYAEKSILKTSANMVSKSATTDTRGMPTVGRQSCASGQIQNQDIKGKRDNHPADNAVPMSPLHSPIMPAKSTTPKTVTSVSVCDSSLSDTDSSLYPIKTTVIKTANDVPREQGSAAGKQAILTGNVSPSENTDSNKLPGVGQSPTTKATKLSPLTAIRFTIKSQLEAKQMPAVIIASKSRPSPVLSSQVKVSIAPGASKVNAQQNQLSSCLTTKNNESSRSDVDHENQKKRSRSPSYITHSKGLSREDDMIFKKPREIGYRSAGSMQSIGNTPPGRLPSAAAAAGSKVLISACKMSTDTNTGSFGPIRRTQMITRSSQTSTLPSSVKSPAIAAMVQTEKMSIDNAFFLKIANEQLFCPSESAIGAEEAERMFDIKPKELGLWRFCVKVTSLDIDDVGRTDLLTLLNTAQDCGIFFKHHGQNKKKRGEGRVYFNRLLSTKSFMQNFFQLTLVNKKAKFEIIRKIADSIGKDVVSMELDLQSAGSIAKPVTALAVVDAANGAKGDKSVHITNVPKNTTQELLFVVFPTAICIDMPTAGDDKGTTIIQFRSHQCASDVIRCYTSVIVNKSKLKLVHKGFSVDDVTRRGASRPASEEARSTLLPAVANARKGRKLSPEGDQVSPAKKALVDSRNERVPNRPGLGPENVSHERILSNDEHGHRRYGNESLSLTEKRGEGAERSESSIAQNGRLRPSGRRQTSISPGRGRRHTNSLRNGSADQYTHSPRRTQRSFSPRKSPSRHQYRKDRSPRRRSFSPMPSAHHSNPCLPIQPHGSVRTGESQPRFDELSSASHTTASGGQMKRPYVAGHISARPKNDIAVSGRGGSLSPRRFDRGHADDRHLTDKIRGVDCPSGMDRVSRSPVRRPVVRRSDDTLNREDVMFRQHGRGEGAMMHRKDSVPSSEWRQFSPHMDVKDRITSGQMYHLSASEAAGNKAKMEHRTGDFHVMGQSDNRTLSANHRLGPRNVPPLHLGNYPDNNVGSSSARGSPHRKFTSQSEYFEGADTPSKPSMKSARSGVVGPSLLSDVESHPDLDSRRDLRNRDRSVDAPFGRDRDVGPYVDSLPRPAPHFSDADNCGQWRDVAGGSAESWRDVAGGSAESWRADYRQPPDQHVGYTADTNRPPFNNRSEVSDIAGSRSRRVPSLPSQEVTWPRDAGHPPSYRDKDSDEPSREHDVAFARNLAPNFLKKVGGRFSQAYPDPSKGQDDGFVHGIQKQTSRSSQPYASQAQARNMSTWDQQSSFHERPVVPDEPMDYTDHHRPGTGSFIQEPTQPDNFRMNKSRDDNFGSGPPKGEQPVMRRPGILRNRLERPLVQQPSDGSGGGVGEVNSQLDTSSRGYGEGMLQGDNRSGGFGPGLASSMNQSGGNTTLLSNSDPFFDPGNEPCFNRRFEPPFHGPPHIYTSGPDQNVNTFSQRPGFNPPRMPGSYDMRFEPCGVPPPPNQYGSSGSWLPPPGFVNTSPLPFFGTRPPF